MTERKFKYVVSIHPLSKIMTLDCVTDWRFHDQAYVPEGNTVIAAAWFSIDVVDNKYVPESIKVFGKSEGYRMGPRLGDEDLLKQHMGPDNIYEFHSNGAPIKD